MGNQKSKPYKTEGLVYPTAENIYEVRRYLNAIGQIARGIWSSRNEMETFAIRRPFDQILGNGIPKMKDKEEPLISVPVSELFNNILLIKNPFPQYLVFSNRTIRPRLLLASRFLPPIPQLWREYYTHMLPGETAKIEGALTKLFPTLVFSLIPEEDKETTFSPIRASLFLIPLSHRIIADISTQDQRALDNIFGLNLGPLSTGLNDWERNSSLDPKFQLPQEATVADLSYEYTLYKGSAVTVIRPQAIDDMTSVLERLSEF